MINATAIPLNCGEFIGPNTPKYQFLKPSFGGDKFLIETTPQVRTLSSASSSSTMQKDVEYVVYSGATTITDYRVNIRFFEPNYNSDIIIMSNNSGVILSPNSLGLASGVSAGSTTLLATSNNFFNSKSVNIVINSGVASSGIIRYTAGSLAKNTTDAIDIRISGVTASASTKLIFSTQNHTTSTYVRNTGCWASDLNLTPISPWNSTGGATRAGALISPRHIIFAAHYQIEVGATIRFIDQNNNVITRTMTNKLTHPAYRPYYPDITIGVLNSDVPASIGYAKILPQNWANYLPSLSSNNRVPCLYLDQEEKALIIDLISIGDFALFASPSVSSRLAFYEKVTWGDSGNPFFLIINNELVILSVVTYDNGSGTSIIRHKNIINSMMNTLGGGYTLSEIDLSSFSYFS
jgi:hypothetical protein